MRRLVIHKKEKCKNVYHMFDRYVTKCKEVDKLQKVTNKRKTGNKYELVSNFNYENNVLEYRIFNNEKNDRK